MRVGLIDVDSRNFPNLALMKISAYHKKLNDDVSMYMPIFDYDVIYMSKVFTFTKDIKCIRCNKIIKGGTGYDIKKKLPNEIDKMYPDYSLYNITDTAYGYLTRGCFRNCAFCIVSAKEGNKVLQEYKLSQFWNGQKNIKLLDPNISGASNFIELINELAETGAWIDFTQGLDLRLMTENKIEAIKKVKVKLIHFAWDKIEDADIIIEKLKLFINITKYHYSKISVYVLVNFNSTFEQDLYRIYKIRELGANPFVMIYQKEKADRMYRHLQRYVNGRAMFRSKNCKNFNEYMSFIKDKNILKRGKLF